MNLHQLSPWNWFKKEHQANQNSAVPVHYREPAKNYPVHRLHQEIDRVLDNLFQPDGSGLLSYAWPQMSNEMTFNPQLDINETDTSYVIVVDVPGIDRKNIDVQIQGESMIVSGEKKHEKTNSDNNYHCIERSYGAFKRILSLPQDCDSDKVKADYENGVLTIEIQKNPKEKSQGRRIEINQILD